MSQLQGIGIESPDNPERFPDDNIPASLSFDLGLEPVYDPSIFHSFDALG